MLISEGSHLGEQGEEKQGESAGKTTISSAWGKGVQGSGTTGCLWGASSHKITHTQNTHERDSPIACFDLYRVDACLRLPGVMWPGILSRLAAFHRDLNSVVLFLAQHHLRLLDEEHETFEISLHKRENFFSLFQRVPEVSSGLPRRFFWRHRQDFFSSIQASGHPGSSAPSWRSTSPALFGRKPEPAPGDTQAQDPFH